MTLNGRARRELAIVLGFAVFISAFSLNEAYHIDEPWFLAMARQILKNPLHPEAFSFNWHGLTMPLAATHAYPSYHSYLLAGALWLTGGAQWATRLLFLPFDLMAGAALYALAARYLSRPLLPALIVMAAPAYFVNMPHLMSEKVVAPLTFAGVYSLAVGVEERRTAWYWASALLAAAAMTFNFSAAFLIVLAGVYSIRRKLPWARVVGYLCLSLLPAALYLGWGALHQWGRISSLDRVIGAGTRLPWRGIVHRLRALFAFMGGCGAVTMVWPWLARPGRGGLSVACLAAAAALFSPWLDWKPVHGLDRWLGILFSAGALRCAFMVWEGRRGRELWLWWAAIVAALQATLYWGVLSRYVLFMLAPLVFSMAAALESRWDSRRLSRLYVLSLAGSAALSMGLAWVDMRYAGAQRDMARLIGERYIAKGKKVWFTGHWGLQYYMERAGAVGLDLSQGGWDAVGRGDVVVVPRVNVDLLRPRRRVLSNALEIPVECPLPLRLLGTPTRQAGFYGGEFLPYTISLDPVDSFTIVEVL